MLSARGKVKSQTIELISPIYGPAYAERLIIADAALEASGRAGMDEKLELKEAFEDDA